MSQLHAALDAHAQGDSIAKNQSAWLSHPPAARKPYVLALTSGRDPATIQPPVVHPPAQIPMATQATRRARSVTRWTQFKSANPPAKKHPAANKRFDWALSIAACAFMIKQDCLYQATSPGRLTPHGKRPGPLHPQGPLPESHNTPGAPPLSFLHMFGHFRSGFAFLRAHRNLMLSVSLVTLL